MLTIQKIADSVSVDSDFNFDGGWYSSTLCIMYALTPAPVGQPRQIVAAHLWNMLVGILCRQIPSGELNDFMEWAGVPPESQYGMPLIWRQALACALGIAGQAYIGIIHPPATGLATTFAARPNFSWGTMASVMITDVVVIILSMMILNMSAKKQYPLYWIGLGWEGSGGTLGYLRSKTRRFRRGAHSVKSGAAHSVRSGADSVKEAVRHKKMDEEGGEEAV